MVYNPVTDKRKIILHTRPLKEAEVVDFFSTIKVLKTLTVEFFDPYTGQNRTISCYRGDRAITMNWNRSDVGKLFNSTDISLIELQGVYEGIT